ncbi:MAG: Ig-like domain-containing protein [Paludibacteraceae bacterium]|nr:Ig-like domain-containing protein [Paludibacteraceae bacterium]
MKNSYLKILFFWGGGILLAVLASCNKKEPSAQKLESLKFKQASYTIDETNIDFNLRKELEGTPAGVIDGAKINWKVSDESVAAMEGSYLVPITSGEVKVTATIQDISATCSVTIEEVPVTSLKLEDMDVPLNGTVMVKATVEPSLPLTKFSWSSNNNGVATIDETGLISGVSKGTATITATRGDVTASCKVTVKYIQVENVKLSKSEIIFSEVGQEETITAIVSPDNASYPSVTWSSSNMNVATVENGVITSVSMGAAVITATADGESVTCNVVVASTIKDCEGHSYPIVKIGNQIWMAENLRCTKYDTESERAGATLSTSKESTYAPYYTDASDRSNWKSTEYSSNLSDEQVKKLGYLYNWAAAVGLATESEAKGQTSAFSGNRQGICPNGWHIPKGAEWVALKTYIEETDGKGGATAGKHLKTTSGWYSGGGDYKAGADTYSFAALPAGHAYGSTVSLVGYYANFWAATPDDSDSADDRILHYGYDYLDYTIPSCYKYYAQSVRCVRN